MLPGVPQPNQAMTPSTTPQTTAWIPKKRQKGPPNSSIPAPTRQLITVQRNSRLESRFSKSQIMGKASRKALINVGTLSRFIRNAGQCGFYYLFHLYTTKSQCLQGRSRSGAAAFNFIDHSEDIIIVWDVGDGIGIMNILHDPILVDDHLSGHPSKF